MLPTFPEISLLFLKSCLPSRLESCVKSDLDCTSALQWPSLTQVVRNLGWQTTTFTVIDVGQHACFYETICISSSSLGMPNFASPLVADSRKLDSADFGPKQVRKRYKLVKHQTFFLRFSRVSIPASHSLINTGSITHTHTHWVGICSVSDGLQVESCIGPGSQLDSSWNSFDWWYALYYAHGWHCHGACPAKWNWVDCMGVDSELRPRL